MLLRRYRRTKGMVPVTGMRVLCACMVVMVIAGGAPAQQPGTMSENFDAGQPQGWELMGGASVANAGRGGALVFTSEGAALWLAANVTNFSMQFGYLPPQEGMAQVMFRMGGEPPNNGEYQLRFEGSQMSLFRMGNNQEQWLGSGQAKWTAGNWQTIVVTATGGNIQVAVGGQPVLTASDPQPRTAGFVGFASGFGNGAAFDNISITSSGGNLAVAQPMGGTTAVPTQPGNVTANPPMQTISQPVGGGGGGGNPPPGSASVPQGASGMFLRVGQLSGDSMAQGLTGWSDAVDYSFDITRLGAKRATIVPLVVTKYVDSASPLLRLACCKAQVFSEVQFVAGGASYMRITLGNVRIASISGAVDEDSGAPVETLTFTAGTVIWEYVPQSATGGQGPTTRSTWNIDANREF